MTLDDGNDDVSFGSGADSFHATGEGSNTVSIGNYYLGTTDHGGVDTITFGAQDGPDTVILSMNDTIGVPGVNNGSGTTIAFSENHTGNPGTVVFNSPQNSAYTIPDMISNFISGSGHDVLNFAAIDGFKAGTLTYTAYLDGFHITSSGGGEATFVTVSSEGAVNGAIAGEHTDFATSQFNMVFVSTTGNLYINSGTTPANAPPGEPSPFTFGAADGNLTTAYATGGFGDMQITLVGVTSLDPHQTGNIHYV